MHDERLDRLAHHILHYSVEIQKGDRFALSLTTGSIPLGKALLEETRRIGAFAYVEILDEELQRLSRELIDPDDGGFSEDSLKCSVAWGLRRFEDLKASISIRSFENDMETAGVDPRKVRLAAQTGMPLQDLIINHRKWVLFEYPTKGQAQKAGMSYDRFFDFVLDVSCVDYAKMRRDVEPLKARMQRTDRVRLVGPGTDLSFSIKGIPAIPCCGEYNIPDGEIFTAPVRDSINGTLAYNTPSIYWGKKFSDIRFTFKDGRIEEASCTGSQEDLLKILDSDPGARYIGEFAIGLNPLIREPFCNTLFDEKIYGSFHFTPGRCYDDAPNGNESAVHWDLVCIQRPEYGGGEMYFDGELVRKDGLFLPEDLLGLN
jgi:aminopeptidase